MRKQVLMGKVMGVPRVPSEIVKVYLCSSAQGIVTFISLFENGIKNKIRSIMFLLITRIYNSEFLVSKAKYMRTFRFFKSESSSFVYLTLICHFHYFMVSSFLSLRYGDRKNLLTEACSATIASILQRKV